MPGGVAMCPEGRGVARETERLLYCSTQPLKAGIGSCRMTLSRGFSPRGCNSVGRVPASQAGCRGFESLHPLSVRRAIFGPLFLSARSKSHENPMYGIDRSVTV